MDIIRVLESEGQCLPSVFITLFNGSVRRPRHNRGLVLRSFLDFTFPVEAQGVLHVLSVACDGIRDRARPRVGVQGHVRR